MTSSPVRGKASRFDGEELNKLKNKIKIVETVPVRGVKRYPFLKAICSGLLLTLRSSSYILNSEPGNQRAPPTLETSLQHVALFINLSVAKCLGEKSRGSKRFHVMESQRQMIPSNFMSMGYSTMHVSEKHRVKVKQRGRQLCNRLLG